MTLSDGLIYFGVICILLAIFIIFNDGRMRKKTMGNKKLAERIEFFKSKWQGDHAKLILAPFGISVLLTVLSIITDLNVFLYLAGVVVLFAYVIIYNKMMIYVEEQAFNGKGLEEDEQD